MTDELKALEADLKKKYNKEMEVIKRASALEQRGVISLGALALDYITQIGGAIRGSTIEVSGAPGAGKSTLSMRAIAQAQQKGLACVLVNIEGLWDKAWAEEQGVDTEALLYCEPLPNSSSLALLADIVEDGSPDLVVFDSIGTLVNDKEFEANDSKARVGGSAGMISSYLKRISPKAWANEVTLVLINQVRANMNSPIPNATITPGGYYLQHSADLRIKLTPSRAADNVVNVSLRTGHTKAVTKTIAHRVVAEVLKNKYGSAGLQTSYLFVTDEHESLGLKRGIDDVGSLADIGIALGVIEQGGAYYSFPSFPDGRIKGKNAVYDFLRGDLTTQEAVRAEIINRSRHQNPAFYDTEELVGANG